MAAPRASCKHMGRPLNFWWHLEHSKPHAAPWGSVTHMIAVSVVAVVPMSWDFRIFSRDTGCSWPKILALLV